MLENRDFKILWWDSNTILLAHYSPSADGLLRGEICVLGATQVTTAIIFVIGLTIFLHCLWAHGGYLGPEWDFCVGCFQVSCKANTCKKISASFYLLPLGTSDIMHVYLFSTCLIIVSLFVYVLFSPHPEWFHCAPNFFLCIFISLGLTITLDVRKEGEEMFDEWMNEHWMEE